MAGLLAAPTLAQFNQQLMLGKPPVTGGAVTAWDPANMGAGITLSTTTTTNDTAAETSGSTGWQSVYSTGPTSVHSSGKYYLEFLFSATDSSTNGFIMGFTNGSVTPPTSYCGSDINGVAVQVQTGALTPYFQGSWTGAPPNLWTYTSAVGDRFAFALDIGGKQFWIANITKGSGWSRYGNWDFLGAPQTPAGGAPFTAMTNTNLKPCWSGNRSANNIQVVLITKTSSFTGTMPSGFSGWDP
jgi:hypothetical protein